jgi:hypothetical protein
VRGSTRGGRPVVVFVIIALVLVVDLLVLGLGAVWWLRRRERRGRSSRD